MNKKGFVEGLAYFIGIIIIILGIASLASSASPISVTGGLTGIIIGFIWIWLFRRRRLKSKYPAVAHCSNCGNYAGTGNEFCPNCGSKMR